MRERLRKRGILLIVYPLYAIVGLLSYRGGLLEGRNLFRFLFWALFVGICCIQGPFSRASHAQIG